MILYSISRLVLSLILLYFALKKVVSTNNKRETNPLHYIQSIIRCFVNWSTMTEIPLFILTFIYAIKVYTFDNCLCPVRSQLAIFAVIILLSWFELIILSTQFQFIGVYVLMLSRVLVTFLKTSLLLCLLISGFGLVFYLSQNDPYVVVSWTEYLLSALQIATLIA